MADVVRLAIVYETSQAAANLTNLNRITGTSTTSFKKAGVAALLLAQGMDVGSISAAGMAGNLGRVASVLFGPWGIALGLAIGLLTLFKNKQDKARDAAVKFDNQLRDVKRSVDDLFRSTGKTPFETEVEHITDAINDLEDAIQKTHTSWLWKFRNFLSGFNTKVFGIDLTFGKNDADPEAGPLGRLRGQRGRLTPEAELSAARGRQAAARGLSHGLSALFDLTQQDRLGRQLDEATKNLEELVTLGLDPMGEEAQNAKRGISELAGQLQHLQRTEALVMGGLQTMANALEDFVITGTLAFTDFLNNILRMLYRDFSGGIIQGIGRSLFRNPGPGSGGGSTGVQVLGDPGSGGPMGSVTSQVNFNIQTMDAQGVATFIQQHGATIAAEVTRQAGRSAGMRRVLRHG